MLSKVLKKETCAECRFCCSFRRCSLWETPLFPKEVMDSLEKKGSPVVFKKQTVSGKEYGQMDLTGKYRTQDSEEEAACEFLDAHKGVHQAQGYVFAPPLPASSYIALVEAMDASGVTRSESIRVSLALLAATSIEVVKVRAITPIIARTATTSISVKPFSCFIKLLNIPKHLL